MQRSMVVLPDPLGPMTDTFSPALHLEVDALEHVERAVALVQPRDADERGAGSGGAGPGSGRLWLDMAFAPAAGRYGAQPKSDE